MDTKTVEVDTDWLSTIDGRDVKSAIQYLQTLNQDHILNYHMEGDTHGCDVTSSLYYSVPMTDEEIYNKLVKHYTKEITLYEDARRKHLADGRTNRVEICDRMLLQLNKKFAEIKVKYGK